MSSKNLVSQVMTKNVLSTDTSTNLVEAARLMTERGIGCVVITENGKPVGVLTEKDIMKKIVGGKNVFQENVRTFMSQPLISVPPDMPVVDALDLMKKKNIRRLPIVNEGRLEGLITVHRDLLYWALTALRTSSADSAALPHERK
ncbi:MAG TPA: CBS domain-containing protein [Candidatus Acidoferrum sp.]|nr:CBS domain-containing protein [Candidatus Acidoferrum sp.]